MVVGEYRRQGAAEREAHFPHGRRREETPVLPDANDDPSPEENPDEAMFV